MKKKLGTPKTKPNLFSDRSKKSRTKLFERLLSGKNFKEEEKKAIYSSIHQSELQKKSEQGDPMAQFYYGLSFLPADGQASPHDSEQYVYWITQSAELGDHDAQIELAVMYDEGEYVPQDHEKAIYWYEKVAEKGNREIQFQLAMKYFDGDGIPQNYEQAKRWFNLASDQGHVGAMNILGIMYQNGYGVEQNYKMALRFYIEAAEEECVEACYNLGIMYSKGQGVVRNLRLAYAWFSIGAVKEDQECIELRAELEEKLSAEHLNEARYLTQKIQNRIDTLGS